MLLLMMMYCNVLTAGVDIGAADDNESDDEVRAEAISSVFKHPAVLAGGYCISYLSLYFHLFSLFVQRLVNHHYI